MLKNIRHKLAAVISAGLLMVVPVALPAVASAATPNIQNCLGQGTNLTAPSGGTNCSSVTTSTNGATNKVNNLVRDIINIFSWVVGVVSVIMIIVGGFRYITSGGDSNNVSAAKNTIIYAIIGLVIVALAQFIVQFVLNKVTSTT